MPWGPRNPAPHPMIQARPHVRTTTARVVGVALTGTNTQHATYSQTCWAQKKHFSYCARPHTRHHHRADIKNKSTKQAQTKTQNLVAPLLGTIFGPTVCCTTIKRTTFGGRNPAPFLGPKAVPKTHPVQDLEQFLRTLGPGLSGKCSRVSEHTRGSTTPTGPTKGL